MFELNKNYNLLEEQLAESGLEMQWVSAVLGGISAATSLIGGIDAASKADKANKEAEAAYEEQKNAQEAKARAQNVAARRQFEADRDNYRKQAKYNYDTAIKKWQYDTTIRALEEKTNAEAYLINNKITNKQLTFNALAEQQAQKKAQLSIADARSEYAFNRQDALVAELQAEGKARLGQAGGSMNKRVQASMADIGRQIAVMDASLTGEISATTLEMFDIGLGRYAADARVEASRMLRPPTLPDIPAPTMPPEPAWIAPLQVEAGYVQRPVPQSVTAPIMQGISGAVSGLSDVFSAFPKKQDTGKFGDFPSTFAGWGSTPTPLPLGSEGRQALATPQY
jgi:hypothetical protein